MGKFKKLFFFTIYPSYDISQPMASIWGSGFRHTANDQTFVHVGQGNRCLEGQPRCFSWNQRMWDIFIISFILTIAWTLGLAMIWLHFSSSLSQGRRTRTWLSWELDGSESYDVTNVENARGRAVGGLHGGLESVLQRKAIFHLPLSPLFPIFNHHPFHFSFLLLFFPSKAGCASAVLLQVGKNRKRKTIRPPN